MKASHVWSPLGTLISMFRHLWRAFKLLFPSHHDKRVIVGLIAAIAIVPVSEMAVAKVFADMVLNGQELFQQDRNTALGKIALFFLAFAVARLMHHAARAYRVGAIRNAFLASPRKRNVSEEAWEWAMAFEMTGVLAIIVHAAMFAAFFIWIDPVVGIVNVAMAGVVVTLVSLLYGKQLEIQRGFVHSKNKATSDSIALRVRTRVLTGERGAVLGSGGLILMLAFLLWRVIVGESETSDAIVLFLGLRLQYGQLGNLSAGVMRFARASASREKRWGGGDPVEN